MTSEIPEDVMKAAEEALDNMLCNSLESCGSTEALRAESIKDIASAVLAERLKERERCAKIAEVLPSRYGHLLPREEVSAAIRSPET